MATKHQRYCHRYPDIKVLYVEDERYFREKLLRVLKRRFSQIYVAEDGTEGFDLFQKYHPDLIIADIKMNPIGGLEMIKKIRQLDDQVQIIVTTAQDDNDCFIQSIEHKVNHFILKPINLELFLQGVQKAVSAIQLNKKSAMIDPLTRTYNRQKFMEIIENEINRAERYDHFFSIILIGIEEEKEANNTVYQHVENEVFTTVSTIIQQRIRESDILARWEEDKFILLTPETNSQGAVALAESIRLIIEEYPFKNIGKIFCKVGAVEFSKGISKLELLLLAEESLTQFKKDGRNQTSLHAKEL
ncbi:diguanylate cyclase [Neobacillus sp. LXY-1]|uniref:diguanylate cyclase n=1 Tax=Neobacillus sp. LXY-1 TaxID=3379133 RepID=UPI003EE041BB